MSARAYSIRLAVVLLIFVAVVPGAVVGFLYWLQHTPGSRDASIGWGYGAFFLGIPAWIIGLSIALWRLTRPRVVALGLPHAVSLCFIPLVLADWMAIMTFFQHERAWFLMGAAVMLIALIFWPQRRNLEEPNRMVMARNAAGGSFVILALMAAVSVSGWLMTFFSTTSIVFSIQKSPQRFAMVWFFVVVAAQVWVIVEGRLGKPRG